MGATGFDLLAQAGAQSGLEQNQHARQLQDEQRQQNLQRNWSILNDPNSADDVKQAAGQDIKNQYPTPEHKGTFLSDFLHLHLGHKSAQPITPAQAPTSAQPTSSAQGPSSGAVDQLGVPYSSSAPAPTQSTPPLAAAGAAATPQAAMDLWKKYRGPQAIQESMAEERAKNAAGFAQTLADKNNAARIEEAHIRAHGNVSMQKMDAAAQSLGAEDFASASPDIKMAAMKAMASANRAPAWKSVTDGNDVYAVSSLDPTKRTLLGHKNDLTERQEFRTMSNPDGSTFLVPVTVWTKKGSSTPVMETQDDQGGSPQPQSGAPVSSATPQGVPSAQEANPGARVAGTAPGGGAKKQAPTRIPSSSVGAPIPFGGKPSELTKSDTSQYTKLAEDANSKQEALQSAQLASRSPSPSSDQQLIYSWVRANVQGAGRMTQQEFTQAARIGSFGQKVDNWYSLASSGKITPEIRQMLLSDIQRSAKTSQAAADDARTRVQQDMNPEKKPSSTKTPSGPSGKPKTADEYLKSIGVQ